VPLFGYDVFISYSWTDGRAYAESLRDQLAALGLVIFLDDDRLNAGDPLTTSVSSALQRSRVLVLVATPAGLASSYVAEELAEFSRRGRPLIPIAGEAVSTLLKSDSASFHNLAGVTNFSEAQHKCAAENLSVLRPFLHLVGSTGDALLAADTQTIEKIKTSVGVFKAQRTRQMLLVSLVAVFATLAALAWVQRIEAVSQRNVAQTALEQEQLALAREKQERERADAEAKRAFDSLLRGVDQLTGFSDEVLQAITTGAIADPWPLSIMQKLEDSYWGLASDDNLRDIRNSQIGSVFQKIAATYFNMGELERSLSSFERFVAYSRRLTVDDLDNPFWRSALAAALLRLGNERAGIGDFAGRIRDFTEAVRIYESLVDDPKIKDFKRERFMSGPELLAISQANLANAVLLLAGITEGDRRFVSDALIEKALKALEDAVRSQLNLDYVARIDGDVGPKLRVILEQRP